MSKLAITSYNELFNSFKTYISKKDIKRIDESYKFAKEHHEGQKRKSGEDFILHPLNVAYILTSIYADADTIIASLLHDVVEDTDVTIHEIEYTFGKEVAKLVDGVTRINSLNVSAENDFQVEYYKKIIVGMSEDVRVIIIKLADRLHNMRTLSALSLDKQKANAKETLEILAPIAHRLGIHKIKSELEDLSLKYLKPDVYFDIAERLNNTKIERESIVNEMMDSVSKLLNENGIKHEIKGRAKSIYSIYKKLDSGRKFNEIYDLLAIRVLVEKEQECYWAIGIIHSKFKPIPKRFKDYIAMPKTNLYQTLHTTVFGLDGYCFEIQVRTYGMDEVAENGIASHWAYKEHKDASLSMQNITEQKLQFYKSIIELNQEKMSSEDFISSVKDEVLNNSIYVFTPKGDVIELPKGATPIDFAYRVHSAVGDKMTGAIVNNNIVSLDYKLNSSDIVKVITNKNSAGPSREWLNIATTTQAKNKIKAFFNKNSKDEYIEQGKISLEKELRRKKISITDFMKEENISLVLKELKLDSIEDLYLNIGNSKFSSLSVINCLHKDESKTSLFKVPFLPNFRKNKENDIIISNINNIKTTIANCCKPVPGDGIIGYITKGSGITIHRVTCQNVQDENERIVKAEWSDTISKKYSSELMIYTDEINNILLDVVQVASSGGVIVEKVNTIKEKDKSIYNLLVLVKSLDELSDFINAVARIKGVRAVERTI